MKAKGSMTAAMCLMLLVIMSLLAACIRSARISCARVQASNAMDTALYSLFLNMIRIFYRITIYFSWTEVMERIN